MVRCSAVLTCPLKGYYVWTNYVVNCLLHGIGDNDQTSNQQRLMDVHNTTTVTEWSIKRIGNRTQYGVMPPGRRGRAAGAS